MSLEEEAPHAKDTVRENVVQSSCDSSDHLMPVTTKPHYLMYKLSLLKKIKFWQHLNFSNNQNRQD